MLATRCITFGVALCATDSLAAQPASWKLEPRPVVRIGTSEQAELSLAAPAGATRLTNGNVVVGDLAEFAIREFTPNGALVKRYARK